MELQAAKCSMCGTRDMVEMPHRDGSFIIFMGCPNCDLDGKGTTTNFARAYLGTGPNCERP